MQGPRLSSHYDRNVPDLTLHLSPHASPLPPPVKPASDSSSNFPSRSPISHPSQFPSNGSIHSRDPPSPSIASHASTRNEFEQLEPSKDSATRSDPNAATANEASLPTIGKRQSDDGETAAGGGAGSGGEDKLNFQQRVWKVLKRHTAFIGPGVVASIAYLDPGNWSTDLQAGSAYGYSHLFVILMSGLMALFFQILATRLGCVSDEDYATHCRIALHNRDSKYKMFYRWGVLYPLYVVCEIGIIFTDLAELIGSAIAINLLIPAIPLWGCVLITAADVLLILLLFNQYPTRTVTRSMRLFELLLGLLVLTVLGSFVALLVEVKPKWDDVFLGYVPSSGVINNGGIYIAVGIIGATVMPHAFFIGSKMACMRRLPPSAYGDAEDERLEDDDEYYYKNSKDEDSTSTSVPEPTPVEQPKPRHFFMPSLHLPQPFKMTQAGFDFVSTPRIPMDDLAPSGEPSQEQEQDGKKEKKPQPVERPRPKPSLNCIKAHLTHACFDVAGSLLGFALVVNSAILILAAAVFYYGEGRSSSTRGEGISDLFDAYALVKQYLGQALAYIFAVALLAAGQSASITVTLAGQLLTSGMLRWHTKPWKRRLVTRLISIVPSLAVSIGVGRTGISTLLVASQVALSIVLTFVLPALIIFTSEHRVMAVPIPNYVPPPSSSSSSPPAVLSRKEQLRALLTTLNPIRKRRLPPGVLTSYANPPIVVYLCWAIWLLISTANVYALYTLAHGEA
ncbi:uncharacterized protein JCM6883_000442 [Sporobolomyces salmoneus]|uniref:uncharacterized protein n=1 Tax=Sporobolomyces salmoneus TaxID=183962 RepID=UPI00317CEDBA